jgi:hypothetical protein
MAALSAVQTATTLTPPSSSHGDGNGFSWDFTSAKHEVGFPPSPSPCPGGAQRSAHHVSVRGSHADLVHECTQDRPYHEKTTLKSDATNGIYRSHHVPRDDNGSALELDTSSKASSRGDRVNGPGAGSRSHSIDDEDDSDDRPDNVVDMPFDDDYQRSGRSQMRDKEHLDMTDQDSKWIHRDLLAKIESQELQAAGITLPQSRSRSRPRRERSHSSARKPMQDNNASRSRKDSSYATEPKTPDTSEAINGWDSRPIEEADAEADAPAKHTGGSRIPVPKKSPLPIPTSHLERDKLMRRENSPEELEKKIEMPKARSRSNSTTLKNLEPSPPLKAPPVKRAATTDSSPKKQTTTVARKGTAPTKSIPPEARGKVKPKPKNGAGGSARPSTRSGERELSIGSKPMEGDPPWLVSAYKPDPRLPPDQQLLPTVARRLQQEKWEQEGKFGSIYDKDFRPLTGEGFLAPPENMPSSSSASDDIVKQEVEKPAEDWPLKAQDIPKSPVSPARSSSYSTMPKIQDKPPASPLASPLASPKPPQRAESPEPMQITRVPDIPEKEPEQTGKKEKGGCGCCIVM